MKWQFEVSDCPVNVSFPIIANQINDRGVKRGPFYLSVEDFIQALNKTPESLLDSSSEKSTPPLPFGSIRYSVNETRTKERLTLEIPQKQWEIRYGDDNTFFSIGFPRMVVQFLVASILDKKVVEKTIIYAVSDDKKPITDETELFTFPYPNVGKDSAVVCWGGNERIEVKSLVELERAFNLFVAAPFGEDYGALTTLGITNFRKLIDHIEDKPFEDDWLVPSNKTFGQLFTTTDN